MRACVGVETEFLRPGMLKELVSLFKLSRKYLRIQREYYASKEHKKFKEVMALQAKLGKLQEDFVNSVMKGSVDGKAEKKD